MASGSAYANSVMLDWFVRMFFVSIFGNKSRQLGGNAPQKCWNCNKLIYDEPGNNTKKNKNKKELDEIWETMRKTAHTHSIVRRVL